MRSSKRSVELAVHLSPNEQGWDPNRVHLWLLDLDGTAKESAHPLLTSDELERAKRLKDPVQRSRLVRRFALSRQVLANVMGIPPGEVAFVEGVCGKPRAVPMHPDGQVRDINFNLSHSENVLAVAVGYGVDLGVDVEVFERSEGTLDFYGTWTLQEAVAKLVGVGIVSDVQVAPSRPFATRSLRLNFAGRDLLLAVAVAESSSLPDPYQGALPKDPLFLRKSAIDLAGQ